MYHLQGKTIEAVKCFNEALEATKSQLTLSQRLRATAYCEQNGFMQTEICERGPNSAAPGQRRRRLNSAAHRRTEKSNRRQ